MSLTDLQAGLMLGFTGGLAAGGLLALVSYTVSYKLAIRRARQDEQQGRSLP
jgi:hypothetical protein